MARYEDLGVRRIINATARLTRLGGSLMSEPVLAAMREAAGSYVDMHALQAAVGQRLATLTRNEAAYVCTGASTGLFLATLACMTGGDLQVIAGLPHRRPSRHEVIVHRAHRIPYLPAVELAGATLVEIGNVNQTLAGELETAMSEQTAAVLYIAGEHLSRGALPLSEVVRLAHARGLPVIVDGAAQLPPVENLWRYTRDLGADLAVFSGGKDLRGPQSSGFVVGRPDLIAACAANGAPHQRLGRPMKVGKEEMMGLLTAVELYIVQDHAARLAGFEATVQFWCDRLGALPGVTAERAFPNEAGQPTPRLHLRFDPARAGLTGEQVRQALWEGEPGIVVTPAGPDGIFITPDTIDPGEEQIIADRLTAVLQAASTPAVAP
ncbi:MAG: aminotransferase class V-fold PLP-dependent enzyme [Chloroflexi bacterium]|nr:aminotransferase class V-fold PLP-dependent enzyme [Chloroflexota bacterium]